MGCPAYQEQFTRNDLPPSCPTSQRGPVRVANNAQYCARQLTSNSEEPKERTVTQTPDPTSQIPDEFETGFVLPKNFQITPVDSLITAAKGGVGPRIEEGTIPPLGPLNAFTGTFVGNGFNTIFRPKSTGLDNLLELNLTSETLSFMKSLGQVPNRGMVQ